jgi:hypothetical protein
VGGIGWEHDDDGTAVDVRQFVRLREVVRRQIDPEPVAVRVPDGGRVADGLRGIPDHRLVGVSPTAFPGVRFDQLGEHVGVDIVAIAGKIPSLIVTPEAAGFDGCDEGEEGLPRHAALTSGHFAEMP